MSELLSPVGNKEAFYAAISNGCDAVYLGLNKHNARAYADNFTLENIKEYIDFAHLRNVRVFITLNTIIYDEELDEVYKIIDELAKLNADAIIVQDLALLNYAINNYKSLEVHASTQMGIDDNYGASLLKELGVKRIVLARETPINVVKEIKEKTNIEVETFIHGALCVSYSGNCFMSASIGERSGNRGRCAGCCRKLYTLINLDENTKVKTGYLLSLKDLNLSNHIKNMTYVDSFKIEGRMKEEAYVASVTNTYRKLIDNEPVDKNNLEKVFNRTYTKGFVNSEDSKEISNIDRPNNYGYLIGKVVKVLSNKIHIKLYKQVNQGDHIRIENEYSFNDTNMVLSKIFDLDHNVVETSNKVIVIYTDKKVKLNSLVYKTRDVEFYDSINVGKRNKEYKKIGINASINVKSNEPILLKLSYKNHVVYQKSEYIPPKSLKIATTKDDIYNHLNKLNDTPYHIENFDINLDDNLFVPVKIINDLRRSAIEKLNASRLNIKVKRNKEIKDIIPAKHEAIFPVLTVEVSNEEQYELAEEMGIENIYFKNIIRRNNARFIDDQKQILFGGLNAIKYYKNKEVELISDYSLNVNNHVSAALLSSLGVNRITLSNELNGTQIRNLIQNYIATYNTHPNLELIVYGRAKIMHSKYCPLRKLDMCGECKKHSFALKDDFESFPLSFNDDCTINLLNSKILNLLDELNNLKGINYFRLVFHEESVEQMRDVINLALDKLNNKYNQKCFDGKIHTHGNYKKQLL